MQRFVECNFCFSTKFSQKIHNLASNKLNKENFTEKLSFCFENFTFDHYKTFICDSCILTLKKFYQIKQNLKENQFCLSPILHTPEAKRSRFSDVRECLRSLQNSPKTPVTPITEQTKEKLPSKARKRLFDHSYIKPVTQSSNATKSKPCSSTSNQNQVHRETSYNAPSANLPYSEEQANVIGNILRVERDLRGVKRGSSILFQKDVEDLNESFESAANELEEKVPFLYEMLNTIIPTANKATIGVIYGMIMHSRNMQASVIQRVLTLVCMKCNADNQLLGRLNKIHITMSSESKQTLIKEMCAKSENKIIEAVSEGKDGKINGDNLDLYVKTNDVRMANYNRDYHFFASDWTPFRFSNADFQSNTYLKSRLRQERVDEIEFKRLKLSEDDIKRVKKYMTIMVGRILNEEMKEFKWLDLVLPNHVEHELKEEMARKSTSFQMPILLCNEAKYEDCIKILESYEKMTSEWYNKAGRGQEYDSLKIPIGGDQLTRVRLDGAKALRAGAHTQFERFDNLTPMIVEMFHTLMDFVEKMYMTFMKSGGSGRDCGTLAHLKVLISRSSVNGKVKSRYKSHEDFLQIVGRSFICVAAMEHFNMEDLEDKPKTNAPPDNVFHLHTEKREQLLYEVVGNFVVTLAGPLSFEEAKESKSRHILVNEEVVSCIVQNGNVVVPVSIQDGPTFNIAIPEKSINSGKRMTVVVPGKGQMTFQQAGEDDLFNYVSYFSQLFLIVLCFKDAISEGDIITISCLLKMMLPHFYAHSPLSKYLVECIDYIIKTEVILPPKLALNVRSGSLVNPYGGYGKNRPADLLKEHQVKETKELIKSLGSNKTENSIVNISKAAPIISSIVSKFDQQVGYKNIKTTHESRCDADDFKCLMESLSRLKPFRYTCGRKLRVYNGIAKNVFEKLEYSNLFEIDCMSIVTRLVRGIAIPYEEEEEGDDNEADLVDDIENDLPDI